MRFECHSTNAQLFIGHSKLVKLENIVLPKPDVARWIRFPSTFKITGKHSIESEIQFKWKLIILMEFSLPKLVQNGKRFVTVFSKKSALSKFLFQIRSGSHAKSSPLLERRQWTMCHRTLFPQGSQLVRWGFDTNFFLKKNFIKQSGTFHYIVENLTSLCQKCLELGDFAESRELSHGLWFSVTIAIVQF